MKTQTQLQTWQNFLSNQRWSKERQTNPAWSRARNGGRSHVRRGLETKPGIVEEMGFGWREERGHPRWHVQSATQWSHGRRFQTMGEPMNWMEETALRRNPLDFNDQFDLCFTAPMHSISVCPNKFFFIFYFNKFLKKGTFFFFYIHFICSAWGKWSYHYQFIIIN